MDSKKGFTLIELMVVIVIIGILSALAIPKMFGVSAKAKAAEAPNVLSNWATLESAYAQETAAGGTYAQIGFQNPTSTWFTYAESGISAAGATNTATVKAAFGACLTTDKLKTDYVVTGDVATNTPTPTTPACAAYTPNFK